MRAACNAYITFYIHRLAEQALENTVSLSNKKYGKDSSEAACKLRPRSGWW